MGHARNTSTKAAWDVSEYSTKTPKEIGIIDRHLAVLHGGSTGKERSQGQPEGKRGGLGETTVPIHGRTVSSGRTGWEEFETG